MSAHIPRTVTKRFIVLFLFVKISVVLGQARVIVCASHRDYVGPDSFLGGDHRRPPIASFPVTATSNAGLQVRRRSVADNPTLDSMVQRY
jgi:hypothetical protein